MVILGKIKNLIEAEFYVKKVIKNNWSRSILIHQIEGGLYLREFAQSVDIIFFTPARYPPSSCHNDDTNKKDVSMKSKIEFLALS